MYLQEPPGHSKVSPKTRLPLELPQRQKKFRPPVQLLSMSPVDKHRIAPKLSTTPHPSYTSSPLPLHT